MPQRKKRSPSLPGVSITSRNIIRGWKRSSITFRARPSYSKPRPMRTCPRCWSKSLKPLREAAKAGPVRVRVGFLPRPKSFISLAPNGTMRFPASSLRSPPTDRHEERVPRFARERQPQRALSAYLKERASAGDRIVLCAVAPRDKRTFARIAERALDKDVQNVADWASAAMAEPGSVLALPASLDAGFIAPAQRMTVIAAPDLVGSRAGHSAEQSAALADIEPCRTSRRRRRRASRSRHGGA